MKRPTRGTLAYGFAAFGAGAIVTVFSRLRLARGRGRRRAARRLPDGPVIVISNHASYVDGIMLALVVRRLGRSLRLLATSGVFGIPLLGRLVRRIGFIPVERGTENARAALDEAAAALEAGEAVGIFPEGRTTRDPHQWPERARTGAVRLSLRTGVPIVPIAMVGTHRVLPKSGVVGALLRNLVLRPKVLVEVGEPIHVRDLATSHEPEAAEVRALADDVMARLVVSVGELRGEVAPAPTGAEPADEGSPSRW